MNRGMRRLDTVAVRVGVMVRFNLNPVKVIKVGESYEDRFIN